MHCKKSLDANYDHCTSSFFISYAFCSSGVYTNSQCCWGVVVVRVKCTVQLKTPSISISEGDWLHIDLGAVRQITADEGCSKVW